MPIYFIFLTAGYILSQFFRSFLPVLTSALERDIGADAADLSTAAGMWFLVFASVQIPVGAALDKIGPKRTGSYLFAIGGGGGALIFAMAQAPWHISVAMGLIGIGCSPVLMSAYYILARDYPASRFAFFAALILAVGQSGLLVGSLPMALLVEVAGWRVSMLGMAVTALLVAFGIHRTVKDPPPVEGAPVASIWEVLGIRAVWPVYVLMLVSYAPAGGLRGLWAGPYFAETFGADARVIGLVTLIMSLAMIGGALFFGPADRILGTRKWINFTAVSVSAMFLAVMALSPPSSFWVATAIFACIGFSLNVYAMIMAHGRAFFPAHMVGRGVSIINFCAMGGVGLSQFATGQIYRAAEATPGTDPFTAIFTFYVCAQILGLVVYLLVQDRTD
ncbi:MFS transporter [Pseudooceanicola sp. C21-150M6]|uniref:MFS transporter n=1 Tax=Pseudooceanicola sp. C21-150M6 TaxID=3434355 RepID=UPI003D7F513C